MEGITNSISKFGDNPEIVVFILLRVKYIK